MVSLQMLTVAAFLFLGSLFPTSTVSQSNGYDYGGYGAVAPYRPSGGYHGPEGVRPPLISQWPPISPFTGYPDDILVDVDIQQCNEGDFECSDGSCISDTSLCDGVNDCGDGSDERDCLKSICPVAGNEFQVNNGNCFHFSTVSTTWEGARQNCKALGDKHQRFGNLAELGNPNNILSDNWLMEEIARKRQWRWLGAHSPNRNGQWVWDQTGRSLPEFFPTWGPKEPNGDGWCVDAWPTGDKSRYYLNDQDCTNLNPYVCQLF